MKSAQRGLVRNFQTPTAAIPDAVVKAANEFNEVNARLTAAEVAVEDCRRAVEEGMAADQAVFDAAVRKGDDRATLKHEHEADAVLALADAERRVKVLEQLVDEEGDAYARTIGEAKEAWMADLTVAEAKAVEAYLTAVDDLERAMAEVADSRIALEWLGRYATGAAVTQDQNRHDVQFRNPPSRFPMKLPANVDRVRGIALVPTDALFGSLRGAVEPPPEPRTTVNAAATIAPMARAGSRSNG
jgi:hypothetical protein